MSSPAWEKPHDYTTGWYEVTPADRTVNALLNGKAYLYFDREQDAWFWKPSWAAPLRSAIGPDPQEIIAKIAVDPYLTPGIVPRVLQQYR